MSEKEEEEEEAAGVEDVAVGAIDCRMIVLMHSIGGFEHNMN